VWWENDLYFEREGGERSGCEDDEPENGVASFIQDGAGTEVNERGRRMRSNISISLSTRPLAPHTGTEL